MIQYKLSLSLLVAGTCVGTPVFELCSFKLNKLEQFYVVKLIIGKL